MNLAVPLASVQDALTTRPTFTFNNITDFVLGLPGFFTGTSRSQIEWAEHLAPTTIIAWLGSNDALSVISTGDPSSLTSVPIFQAAYAEAIHRLAATGATLVVANIPDVTVVPFLTSAEKVAAQIGLPLFVVGPVLGIGPGDFVNPDAFPLIQAILTGATAGPLPGNVVLNASEVATVRSTIQAYNQIIATQARLAGAGLVDIHGLASDIQAHGLVFGGQRLTTDFLGGLFSLDGVHPTNTGYALFANAFIKELNRSFDAGITPVSLEQIRKTDPLVFPAVNHGKSSLGQIDSETSRALRTVLVH
jgi:phospholipase/lecithinase/hemolysin